MATPRLLQADPPQFQFTMFTFSGKWVWTLSEVDAKGAVWVLAKSLTRHGSQERCAAEVERVKASVNPQTKVVVLGQEKRP